MMKRLLSLLALLVFTTLMTVNAQAAYNENAIFHIRPTSNTVSPGETVDFIISVSGSYMNFSLWIYQLDGHKVIDVTPISNDYRIYNDDRLPSGYRTDYNDHDKMHKVDSENDEKLWIVASDIPFVENIDITDVCVVTILVNSSGPETFTAPVTGFYYAITTELRQLKFSDKPTVTVLSESNIEHEHSSSSWQSDKEMHWHKCECGEIFDSSNHSFDAGATTKKATCTQKGEIVYTCKVCGYKKVGTLEESKHVAGEWEIVKEATCTEGGKEQQKCKTCGEVMDEKAIDRLSHSFSEWQVVQEATTEQTGLEEKLCENCGIKESREIPKTEVTTVTTVEELENDATSVTTATDVLVENSTTITESDETTNPVSDSNNAEDNNITPYIVILAVAVALVIAGMIVLVIKKR